MIVKSTGRPAMINYLRNYVEQRVNIRYFFSLHLLPFSKKAFKYKRNTGRCKKKKKKDVKTGFQKEWNKMEQNRLNWTKKCGSEVQDMDKYSQI